MISHNFLNFKCINTYNNKLFFLTKDENVLLSYDEDKQSVEYITKIQRGDSYYCTSCLVNGIIYYFSYLGREFCVYDINRNSIRYVDVELKYEDKNFGGCSSCISVGKYIYVLCGGEKNIPMIRLDTENMKVESCCQWLEYSKRKYQKDEIKNIAHTNLCIVKDSLYLPINVEDIILEYNLTTDEYKFYELPKLGICYYTINYDGRFFWLTGDKKTIIKWDKDINKCVELEDMPNDFVFSEKKGYEGLFYAGYRKGENIYYAPLKANMFIRLNTITQKIDTIKKIRENEFCFYYYDLDNLGIWAQTEREEKGSSEYKIYVINELDCEEKIIGLKRMKYENAINIQDGNSLVNEKYVGMLDWFVKSISNK